MEGGFDVADFIADAADGGGREVGAADELAGGVADFPLCIKDVTNVKDGFVEVKFKTVSGKQDQAAGVVWRFQDNGNYYLCRANAKEGNVVLYKTELSTRKPLNIVGRRGGYGVTASVAKQEWQTLRVEFKGDIFTVKLNGKELFKVKDSTFTGAGRVGLWTKADSVTLFDDFHHGTAK